jgi:hypothetical protein
MRFAVVCSRVPRRSELAAGAIDDEWLVAMSEEHDLELFVDRLSPITDDLQAKGIPVRGSIKRWAASEDGSYRPADAFTARTLLKAHRRRPFDAVLYCSRATTDLAWLEPELTAVPRGSVLGGGACRDLRTVWQSPELFSLLGRRLWAMSGLVASADFLVADVPPESFGFRAGIRFPPRVRARAPWDWTRPEAPTSPISPTSSRGLVAIVATGASPCDLEEVVPRALDRLIPNDDTLIALVTAENRPDANRLRAILDCDRRITAEQLLVVPVGSDGVAASFLEQAALIVVASAAELAIPAVAAAAESRGLLLGDGSLPPDDEAPVLARHHLRQRARGAVHVVSFDDLRAGALDEARELGIASDDLLVVHSAESTLEEASLFEIGGLAGADLVVWGRPSGLYGDADPAEVYPYALAVRAEVLPSLAAAAEHADSVWALIVWALDLDHIDRGRMVLMPTRSGAPVWPLPTESAIRVPWLPSRGVLPPPRYVAARAAAMAPPPPALVSPAWPRLRALPAASSRTFEQWLRGARWWRRLHASLPWRWGLLERVTRADW